ncbi:hypothetical protein ZIOFF_027511 [Zingiber officinale]|uniref:Transcription initiation factor IIF subunit alpha n=1 Tax=Zingiber officinale TaxID=94328 RepID=A0A8J5LDZ6_ZINOF|nr:hypothetical protein ZIOFF_027511 [Zingiber officinale]
MKVSPKLRLREAIKQRKGRAMMKEITLTRVMKMRKKRRQERIGSDLTKRVLMILVHVSVHLFMDHIDFASLGDDWEHEETFTDDDEAVGNDPEEREDLAPEIPAPPEIKQDEEDEDEEDGGLSKSGKELKKLLGKAAGLNESEGEEEEEEDDDDEIVMSPVLAPKQKDTPKDEPVVSTPSRATPPPVSGRSTPSASKSSKAKRKPGSDEKSSSSNNSVPAKKVKLENSIVKDEPVNSSKPSVSTKPPSTTARPGSSTPSTAAVTEEEIRAVVAAGGPVTTQDLVAKFKSRLKAPEDKKIFADILRRISKIQKVNGHNYVVIRDK